jgi:hypothetical protein
VCRTKRDANGQKNFAMPDPDSPRPYERLRAEARSPLKPLRRFIYVGFLASAGLGAFIFGLKLIAGDWATANLTNFGLQLLVTAAMVGLLWVERDRQ